VTDREVLPGWARVRTKCAGKTSVDLWGQSRNPRELPGVTGLSHGVVRVLHLVSEPTLAVTRVCAGQVCGHVARRGTRTDVSNRGVPGLGLIDEDVGLLRG
jgi:hypothetical protein